MTARNKFEVRVILALLCAAFVSGTLMPVAQGDADSAEVRKAAGKPDTRKEKPATPLIRAATRPEPAIRPELQTEPKTSSQVSLPERPITYAALARPSDVSNDAVPEAKAPTTPRKKMAKPETPSDPKLARELKAKKLWLGLPVFIRVFKKSSQLELWMQDPGSEGTRFKLFKSYKICKWSGKLGPKLYEGDKQTPEGFYTLTSWQLGQYSGRWPQSLNLGFPNTFDQALGRTGSHILVHGGCKSTGCFAMTNNVMDEIHEIVTAAFRGGQTQVRLHVYPFRMTRKKLAARRKSQWHSFWKSLKPIYDSFEDTRIPPQVDVCAGTYTLPQQTAALSAAARKKMQCRKVRSAARGFVSGGGVVRIPGVRRRGARIPRRRGPRILVKCNLKLPTCRRWLALQRRKAARKSSLPPRIVRACKTCRRR